MRGPDSLDDYEVFYMELPQADYMDDIEIQDEYDNQAYDQIQGLSEDQVSKIARDSLDASGNKSGDVAPPANDDQAS
jgi:hypothetical protein